jgi:hypothetical protein
VRAQIFQYSYTYAATLKAKEQWCRLQPVLLSHAIRRAAGNRRKDV